VPSLDEFIAASKHGAAGPCGYLRVTTPDQRAAIRLRVEQGVRKWAAFLRWLESEGVTGVTSSMIQGHFERGHDDTSCH
jgi:hypothetical protein